MKNKIIIILFILILCVGYLFFPEKEKMEEQKQTKKTEDSTLSLLFVGDIMMDRGVESMVDNYGKGDFRFPFLKIKEDLEKADVLFGNLEGPISERGLDVGGLYSFRFNRKSIEGIVYAGFGILSLANNHMIDHQAVALEDTMNILKENNIEYVGAGFNKEEAFSLKIIKKEEFKIGLLAFTDLCPRSWRASENSSGIACIEDKEEVVGKIRESKNSADILIVSLHSGVEYREDPSSAKISFFKECIDSGADLVVGHHPHVVQKTENYNQGWIAYSLGNFVFDQSFSQETMESVILKVEIRNKRIEQVSTEDLIINQYFQPETRKEQ